MENSLNRYLTPPKKERLPDAIAAQLKTLILSKKIAIGEKFPPERDLADMLEVSRVVVKQALMLVENAGFIEIKRGPQGGAFVTDQAYKPFSNYIKDLFVEGDLTLDHFSEARSAVECCSIRLAVAKTSAKDIRRLRHLNQKLLDDIQEPTKFHENNREFHVAIADISGNPLIKGIIQSLLDHFSRIWRMYHSNLETATFQRFINNTNKRHQKIIEAMRDKDVKLCEKLMTIDTGVHKELKSY